MFARPHRVVPSHLEARQRPLESSASVPAVGLRVPRTAHAPEAGATIPSLDERREQAPPEDERHVIGAVRPHDGDVTSARVRLGVGKDAQLPRHKEQQKEVPVPTRVLVNFALTMLFHGSQFSLPYVVSVYLVRDLYAGRDGKAASEQVIGQLTGILAASQSISRSVTAYAWGVISDKVGRKACIIVGTAAALISMLFFGLSSSFLAALLSRLLPGACFGSAVALKAMIGDLKGGVGSQATAFSVFNLGLAMGQVIGPILGGTLSYPCRLDGFPLCAEGGLFQRKPFLLPCLAVCGLGLVALASNVFLMAETHPQLSVAPGGWIANLARVLCCRPLATTGQEKSSELLPQRASDLEMGRLNKARQAQEGPVAVEAVPAKLPDRAREGADGEASGSSDAEEEGEEEEGTALLRPEQPAGERAVAGQDSQADPDYRWWRDGNVRLALVGSGLIAFLLCVQDEMGPIFVSAPIAQGGLSMSLEEFTLPLAASGVALALFSLLAYSRLTRRLGAGRMVHVSLLLALPSPLLLPAANLISQSHAAVLVCLYFTACIQCIAKICALNSSTIAVNLVAPKANMGAVNGGAMTLQSAGRALGPIVSGSLWAAVVSLHLPGQQFLGFGAIIVGLVALQFLYKRLCLPEAR